MRAASCLQARPPNAAPAMAARKTPAWSRLSSIASRHERRHAGLQPLRALAARHVSAPFRLAHGAVRHHAGPCLFYTGNTRGELLDALLYAVTQGEGIIKLTGEVGSGKTMLCRMLAERLPPQVDVLYLLNPAWSRTKSCTPSPPNWAWNWTTAAPMPCCAPCMAS
ncbi:ATP-binding protein [Janthinobacterium lividum]|uniref:ATP-binding protein n=1 Tax=Janthinobacterium lividum TaxID=29581 RepID=UPI0033AB6E19